VLRSHASVCQNSRELRSRRDFRRRTAPGRPGALVDDSRAPQLTGVLMVATESGLRLIATDSYRWPFVTLLE